MKAITTPIAFALFLAAAAHGFAQATFTKITTSAIANDQGQFAVGAWVDFKSRGLLDLLVCNYDGTNVLYRNNGDGTFAKVTQGDPVQDVGYHVCPATADLDNDG